MKKRSTLIDVNFIKIKLLLKQTIIGFAVNTMTCVIEGSSVKGNNIFDDVPHISQMRGFKDRYKSNEDNPNLYTRQFSSFVVDRINLMSFSLKAMNDFSWGADAGVKAQMKFLDPSVINYIRLSNDHETVHIDSSDVNDDGLIKKTIHLNTDTSDWVNGWDLDIEVVGESGNVFEETRSIDGVLDSVYDALSKVANYVKNFAEWIWNKVIDAASEAADRAAMLGNMLVDWVKNQVKNTIIPLIQPILDEIHNYIDNIVGYLQSCVEDDKEAKKSRFIDLVYSEVFYSALALSSALITVSYVIQGASFGASTLIGVVTPFVVSYLIQQMFSEHAPYDKGNYSIGAGMDVDDLFGYVEGLIKDKVDGKDDKAMDTLDENTTGPILVIVEVVLGAFGLPFSAGILAQAVQDKSGVVQAAVGLTGVILSMFFAIAAMGYKKKNDPEPEKGNIASVASVALGGIALLFSSWAAYKPGGMNLANKVSGLLGLMAVLTGLTGLVV